MRSVTVFLIGVGSMVAAYCAFALAMTDESPISAPPWLVPAVVVLAGALAAIVDRRPWGLATVLCGACATVVGFSAWLRLTQGPDVPSAMRYARAAGRAAFPAGAAGNARAPGRAPVRCGRRPAPGPLERPRQPSAPSVASGWAATPLVHVTVSSPVRVRFTMPITRKTSAMMLSGGATSQPAAVQSAPIANETFEMAPYSILSAHDCDDAA